jgi:uncharacterized membrane protein YczE
MKKISKTNELLWLFGIIFVAFGVAICSKANLGVSMIAAPAFIIYEAIAPLWSGFSVGMTEYLIQGVILIILCIILRKFRWTFLLAFLVAFIYGYTLDFFIWVFKDVSFDAVWLRWVMLIVGDVLVAFGVACCFKTYMPLQVYELFVSEISKKFSFSITKVKMVFDYTLLTISLILAFSLFGDVKTFDWATIGYSSFHSIGLGTIVTTIINSPIIAFMSKLLNATFNPTPLIPKLESFFKKQK